MKRFVVETSLYEPIEVQIGDKVYTTQPLSNALIKSIGAVEAAVREKKISDVDGAVRLAALVFGAPPEEFETLDLRALNPAVGYALEALNEGRTGGQKNGEAPVVEVDPKN